jgi:hypothetical protein
MHWKEIKINDASIDAFYGAVIFEALGEMMHPERQSRERGENHFV